MTEQPNPVIAKAQAITQKYLTRWGRVMVGVYYFAEIERSSFISFMDSLQTAMQRMQILPLYLWLHDQPRQCYCLIIWSSDFLRPDMNDVWPVIFRLWRRYTSLPLQQLETIKVNSINYYNAQGQIIAWLRFFDHTPHDYPRHQRSFGASHLR